MLVAVIGVVAFMLLTGGDDGGDDDAGTTTTTTTGSDTTDNTEPNGTCTSSSGRCAFIDDITAEGDGFVAAYSTAGFEPLIAGDDSDHHLHFFFDTVPVDEAGVPGSGPWTIWDLDPDGNKVYRSTDVEPPGVPADATQLCVVVANHDHSLDDDPQPSCVDLP